MVDHHRDPATLEPSEKLAADYAREAYEYRRRAGFHDDRAKAPPVASANPQSAADEARVKAKTEEILAADRRLGTKSKYKGPAARGMAEQEARKQLGLK